MTRHEREGSGTPPVAASDRAAASDRVDAGDRADAASERAEAGDRAASARGAYDADTQPGPLSPDRRQADRRALAPPRPLITPARKRRSFVARARTAAGDFVRRVYKKADQDQIFFMGGAIAFNVMVAIIPLALAAVGVAGFFLQGRAEQFGTPAEPVVQYLLQVLPPVSAEFEQYMLEILNDIITNATGLFTIGTLIFAWLATRLIGTLRTALREIFDIQQDRGIIAGKLFDLQMVFVAGTLLTLNIGITVGLGLLTEFGFDFLRIGPYESFARQLIGTALAFFTIWSMFVLIYRYLPARRIQWHTAVISATFTALMFEVMKSGFAWYFANYANYATTYGNLASIAIVVLYVYYMALAFILGGEVGQVAALQRIRRRQKERLG